MAWGCIINELYRRQNKQNPNHHPKLTVLYALARAVSMVLLVEVILLLLEAVVAAVVC